MKTSEVLESKRKEILLSQAKPVGHWWASCYRRIFFCVGLWLSLYCICMCMCMWYIGIKFKFYTCSVLPHSTALTCVSMKLEKQRNRNDEQLTSGRNSCRDQWRNRERNQLGIQYISRVSFLKQSLVIWLTISIKPKAMILHEKQCVMLFSW